MGGGSDSEDGGTKIIPLDRGKNLVSVEYFFFLEFVGIGLRI